MNKLLKYYQILGVQDGAGMTDVASSYRRLCRVYHPDISREPGSEEMMKRINFAYSVLRESLVRKTAAQAAAQSSAVRREKEASNAEAASEWEAFCVLSGYFEAICKGDYEKAYEYLSSHDRQYVTPQSFSRWRKSVARLYLMRSFTILDKSRGASVATGEGKTLRARKFRVSVTEKNTATDETSTGEVTKLTVRENGAWRVFLGYKDLREIARVFENLFEEKRKSEIVKSWEEYYDDLCPGIGLLSMEGLKKEAGREMYRLRRYGGEMTVAGLRITPREGASDAETDETMRLAARAVMSAIRETDVAGHIGGGGFIILLTQLGRVGAPTITRRLAERVRRELESETGREVEVHFAFEQPKGKEKDISKVFERLCKN